MRWGVDWVFYRLAFSEYTRAPVEIHMARTVPHVLSDLAALDAMVTIREMDQAELESKRR